MFAIEMLIEVHIYSAISGISSEPLDRGDYYNFFQMKLFKKVRKLILPLAFVSVGVLGFFQANAAASSNVDCIEFTVIMSDWYNLDVSDQADFQFWQEIYEWCERTYN